MSFFRASVEIFRAESSLILPMETHFAFAFLLKPTWIRDQCFPDSYAHAGWQRLKIFFQLPGRIFWGRDHVEVELKRFNDRALNRDLDELCVKIAQRQLCLLDGRRLLFRVQGTSILLLDAPVKEVA